MESLIRNSNQTKQGLDFTGVENGSIHPTDIDAVLEFDNEHLFLIEAKREGCSIPTGQRLVLERITDSWHGSAMVIFAEHNFNEEGMDIPLRSCFVNQIYYDKKWRTIKKTPLKELLSTMAAKWGINKLKL